MNAQTAINTFESALSIMAAHAQITERADTLTREWSAFRNFEELLTAAYYYPSISRETPEQRELIALYNAAQKARGDSRRAFAYGRPGRKGSLIDPRNYDTVECWYRLGDRVAFWDRHTRLWIAYSLDHNGYQQGPAKLYRNSRDLLDMEHATR